ncbi:MAG: TylF/MycF/NovP-related O-methyltransferase [Chitinophagales bacterium]|jgi:O-methyltransferase|nr:TylF/MycF family methyltransferase [Sphingobacteriales bacterium]
MRHQYLELLKKTLLDIHRVELGEFKPIQNNPQTWKVKLLSVLNKFLLRKGYSIAKYIPYNLEDRINGRDWPSSADTMIGLKRLENIQFCVEEILKNKIEGDFIETGVWRGGAVVWMKGLLKAYENNDKIVWVADSFSGLPKPDSSKYKQDFNDQHYLYKELAIPLETVKYNFEKYDLLDDKVKFLVGWFKDTLPNAPIEKLALLRLDGDMYESTMDALTNLYSKLSIGGYIIIDDWGAVDACKEAVLDFRKMNNILEEIIQIDWSGVYWKKLRL